MLKGIEKQLLWFLDFYITDKKFKTVKNKFWESKVTETIDFTYAFV